MEQCGRELNIFKELVKKTVDAMANAASDSIPMLAKPNNTASWEAGCQQQKLAPKASQ